MNYCSSRVCVNLGKDFDILCITGKNKVFKMNVSRTFEMLFSNNFKNVENLSILALKTWIRYLLDSI